MAGMTTPEAPIETPVLRMEGISKSFPGVRALQDVSLTLRAGEVHTLMGENGAGKSTLMKVLMGIHHPDEGQIRIAGEVVRIANPRDALDRGIAMIHQELSPVLDTPIYENIFLGRELRTPLGLVDSRRMRRQTDELLAELGIPLRANRLMRTLSVAQMQLVEIAKAIALNSRVIVMDEPTSAITESDVTILFGHIRRLRDAGVGIIYISHKMDEIFQISDTITVLRDGQHIRTAPAAELNESALISLMVGRTLDETFHRRSVTPGEPVLKVTGWSSPPAVKDVSLELHRGEVLGLGGLIGAGRSEFVESLFGIRKGSAAEPVLLHGEPVTIDNPRDAIRHGLALVTEDRKGSGLNLAGSVGENITLVQLGRLFRSGLTNSRVEGRIADEYIAQLGIRTPSRNQSVAVLSGGNQQKVVLAKWLLTEPDIIILDEPTRGIDIGAKREIYDLIGEFVEQGKAVILISSEMTELMGLCDRIHVFAEGRITGTLEASEFSQERILELASRFGETSGQDDD